VARPQDLKDRVPPHNQDAERATLGALLLDPDAISAVIRYVQPDDFYENANGVIFRAIISLYAKGKKADLITLTDELKLAMDLDAAGGPGYIANLTSLVPSSANVEYYAKIVQEQAVRRRLLKIAAEIHVQAHDESMEARLVVEEAQKKIFDALRNQQNVMYKSVQEILPRTIEAIEKLCQSKNEYTGIPSGFRALDAMTSGFQNSEFIVIGARPSVGKTAMALTMAQHISIDRGIPVGFFTLEMSDMALMQRLISSETRIPSEKLRTGLLKSSELDRIVDAAGKIYEAPLYIVDMPNMKLLDLRSLARRLKADKGVKIIFIDYLTLVTSENTDLPRHEQIAEISRSLKALARELEIPVVALSQLKRETEGKKPTLADIRESGSVEQDADLVMFLHRERESDRRMDEKSTEKYPPIPTELIIAKQRNGPIGTVDVMFIPAYTRFENLDKSQDRP
jgi:replicative DNA helicase